MSVTITGPVAPTSGQVSGTTSSVDREPGLGVSTEPAPGTTLPPAALSPEPVTTPTPVTLTPVGAAGETGIDAFEAHRGAHGRANRGQVRKQLAHLANGIKHELKQLSESSGLDEASEHELRTLARTFKSSVKSIFKDAKDDIGSGELDGDAILADVRAAYDSVRASAASILAPAGNVEGNAPAAEGDETVPGSSTVTAPTADGEPVEPASSAEPAGAVGTIPGGSSDAPAPATTADPLEALDAVFADFFSSLSDLLSRFVDLDQPGDASAESPAAADTVAPEPSAGNADGSLYARVSSSADAAPGGFDTSV